MSAEDLSSEVIKLTRESLRGKIDRIPSIRMIQNLSKCYLSTGLCTKPKSTGRPRKSHEEVEYLLKTTQFSTRRISRELQAVSNISHMSVHRIAKSSNMRFYRSIIGQKLNAESIERRLAAAKDLHRRIGSMEIDPDNVCFTDECIVGVGPSSNRQNDGFWRLSGEYESDFILREKQYQGAKVHIFVLIHSRIGVVGPYFIDEIEDQTDCRETLTTSRYISMLQDQVIPELKRKLGSSFETCWFQQDGAPVHTAARSLEFLKSVFGRRLVSNKTDCIWPPYSPDLSPLDYWFWSFMRRLIGQHDPQTKQEVKEVAGLACSQISEVQVRKAISDFPIRIMALIDAQGQHFEYGLKRFKRNRRLPITCPTCDQEHQCDCQDCDEICMAVVLSRLFETDVAIGSISDSDSD